MKKLDDYLKRWQEYCSEDLSNIENYDKAIKDPENYVIHHRNGENTSREELVAHEMYKNRPARELIFLTKSEHSSLHSKISGFAISQTGRKRTTEKNAKMVETRKARGKNTKWILCITNNTLYFSASQAMKELGIRTTGNIFKVLNGERNTCNGYQFRYYSNEEWLEWQKENGSIALF